MNAVTNCAHCAPRLNHLPRLYFLHIPKTAGTTVRDWLQPLFREREQLPAEHLADLDKIDPDQLHEFCFAAGHFGWRLMEISDRCGAGFEAITVLRDPIELALSGMRYVNEVPAEDLSKLPGTVVEVVRRIAELARLGVFPGGSADPTLVAEVEHHTQRYRNMMVRFLSAAGTEHADLPALTARDLDVAISRLAGMRFFGLVEDLGWSAALFADAYGLPLRPISSRLNVTREQSDSISPEERQWLRDSDSLDVSLYEFARELFDSRVRDLRRKYELPDDARPEDLEAPLLRSFLETEQGLSLIHSGEVGMSDGVLCEGFHPRFFHAPWDRWIRWSGPGLRSTIFLPLDTSAARHLRIEIKAALSDDIRDGLGIEINGSAIDVQRSYEQFADGSYFMVCEALVPHSVMQLGRQYTSISFVSPATLREEDTGLLVGFALGKIYVQ